MCVRFFFNVFGFDLLVLSGLWSPYIIIIQIYQTHQSSVCSTIICSHYLGSYILPMRALYSWTIINIFQHPPKREWKWYSPNRERERGLYAKLKWSYFMYLSCSVETLVFYHLTDSWTKRWECSYRRERIWPASWSPSSGAASLGARSASSSVHGLWCFLHHGAAKASLS